MYQDFYPPVSSSIIFCERRQLILQQNRRDSCINHQALLPLYLHCKPGCCVYPMEEILLSRGVTIHVPEESSTEIVFAQKQVQAQQLWVILKDDPTWVFCTKAECIFSAHYSRYDNTESDQGRPELEDPSVIQTLPLLLATIPEFQNNSLGCTTGKMWCIKCPFWLYFPA